MSTDNNSKKDKPGDFFWQTYLDASKDEDEARPKNWEGSTTGILTFTGLFAATVAAFIVESYKLLSPDSSDRTNVLLEHLIIAMANTSSQDPVAPPPPEVFSASPSSVITNVFWFSSLLISLICALLATLVQEWSRNYAQDINRRKVLHESLRERAFNHIYIRMGVNRYGMDQFVSWIVALVHLSVFLFAGGLLAFLFPINHILVFIITVVLGSFVAIYCVASLIPLIDKSCPYRTPISYMIAFIYWLALRGLSIVLRQRFNYVHSLRADYFQYLITRQYKGVSRTFLTDRRFQFAWERTYLHISSDTRNTFFRGLSSIISLHENYEVILSHMCANNDLMDTLFQFLDDSYEAMRREPSSSSIRVYPEIFELTACLSGRMYALEVEHHDEHLEKNALTSPWILDVIGRVSQIAEVDEPSQLSARLCLTRVRWSLLLLCRKASEKRMLTLREEEVSDFFRETNEVTFRLGNRNPNAILLLLTTGSYRGYNWENTGASTLYLLHDDDCCRDWRNALTPAGLAHVAACNALTAIAHVLEYTDSQRSHSDSSLDSISDDFGILRYWDSAYQLPRNDKQKKPSSEFVSVLRSAGLNEWLEPGSTFDTRPRDGLNYKFLGTEFGGTCIDILRDLAQHVDFEAYFDHARMRNNNALAGNSARGDEPNSTPDGRDAFPIILAQQSLGHESSDGRDTGMQKREEAQKGLGSRIDGNEKAEKDPSGTPVELDVEQREVGQIEDAEAFDLRTVKIDQTGANNADMHNSDSDEGERGVGVEGGTDLEESAMNSVGPGEMVDGRGQA